MTGRKCKRYARNSYKVQDGVQLPGDLPFLKEKYMNKFEIGDPVVLKTRYLDKSNACNYHMPVMTVTDIHDGGKTITVVWFDRNQNIQERRLKEGALKKFVEG